MYPELLPYIYIRPNFDRIWFLCILWTRSIVKYMETVLLFIMSAPNSLVSSNFEVLYIFWPLFHCKRLVYKKRFRNLTHSLPIDVHFFFTLIFIGKFKMRQNLFAISGNDYCSFFYLGIICHYFDQAMKKVSRHPVQFNLQLSTPVQIPISSRLEDVMRELHFRHS